MQQLETACASIRRRQSTRKLDLEIAQRVQKLAAERGQIGERLGEFDREWDIERAIELNGSAIALTGVLLGASGSFKFSVIPICRADVFRHAASSIKHVGPSSAWDSARPRKSRRSAMR